MKTLMVALAMSTALVSATGAAGAVTLTFLLDSSADTLAAANALAAAYKVKNPDVAFDLEVRVGGSEGDNIVKTRLATGEMSDIFIYNSGSLFQGLKPAQTLADIGDIPAMARIPAEYQGVVSAGGKVYGVPFKPAMAGGILYNRKAYAELGLKVPKSWAEFMANNEKIKAAGKVAVIQSYATPWTSQLFVLADFYNVRAQVPTFADDYTANKAKFATTPAALRGFQHLEEVAKAGFLNKDFGATKYNDGLRLLATGQGVHYPMITQAFGALKQNHADKLGDVGFFAQPGDDAARNGLTVWMPHGLFVPKTTKHLAEVKKFLDFVASPEGCDAVTKANGPAGPYMVKGCTLPAEMPPAVADMLPYFEKDGAIAPALEFLSPVKGPALEQFTVEVGSGIRPAADAAALYDQDVRKQAKQLGLPNW